MTKLVIVYREGYNITYDLEGTIDDAIKFLNKLKEEGWTNLNVEPSCEGGGYNIRPQCRRLETDEEYQQRLEASKQTLARDKERRRQEYERLKNEFGDT